MSFLFLYLARMRLAYPRRVEAVDHQGIQYTVHIHYSYREKKPVYAWRGPALGPSVGSIGLVRSTVPTYHA